jgi:hypothetical protein
LLAGATVDGEVGDTESAWAGCVKVSVLYSRLQAYVFYIEFHDVKFNTIYMIWYDMVF